MNFNYSSDQTQGDVVEVAKDIIAANPDVLVIMDHKPHPLVLLQYVLPHIKKTAKIIFHIFGDFTLYYESWEKTKQFLEGRECQFIVASDRQKHLIDKYLTPPQSSIVCPFPVDKHEFFFDDSLRKEQRKEWGLTDKDFAFVFTGRLSRQKRIHTLLKSFNEFIEKSGHQTAHLFLYGNPDHIGDQFIGLWETEGEYFRKINRIYKSLPESTQKKIHFMGSVPNSELKAVYQASDSLVNLSVHNDEDYGMSVAEAQCSGLPAILTDWGGLASFEQPQMPLTTQFIPVRIGKRAKVIRYESIVNAFESSMNHGHFSKEERKKLSELAQSKFGVEAAHRIVSEALSAQVTPFSSFSNFFDFVLNEWRFSSTPYITPDKNINKLYRLIYSSYVRNN